jgi:hypothetical protein
MEGVGMVTGCRAGASDKRVSIRPAVEPLERRVLLAGITVITHGFQSGSTLPAWVHTMGLAIAQEAGGADIYRLRITGTSTPTVQSFSNIQGNLSTNGESIIEVDWSASSSQFSSSINADQIAAVVVPYIASYPTAQQPFAEVPIHLIGHSRGGSVVSALAGRLGQLGLWVDQLTTLDPHPLTTSDFQPSPPVIDPPVTVSDNVVFADNYWETAQFYPHGQSVTGAANQFLSASGINHSSVHTYYYGTAARSATSDGDGGTIDAAWYTGDARATSGFNYSRILGGARPSGGLSALAGGSQPRTHVALTTTSPFSNVGSLAIAGGSSGLLTNGDAIDLDYRYQDVNGGGSVSFHLDGDANPYNGNVRALGPADPNLPATGATPNSAARDVATTWSSAGIPDGVYRVYASITSQTGLTRYAYMPQPLLVTATGAEVISRHWTGDVSADWADPRNWAPGGVPAASDRTTIQLATGGHVDKSASATLAGTVHLLSGTLNWTGGAASGALIVSGGGGFVASSDANGLNLTVGGTASAIFNTTQHLSALNIGGNGTATLSAGGSKVLVLNALAVSEAGRLDLTDNAMVIRSGGLSAVRSAIAAGFNHGDWNGVAGIASSAAAADPIGVTALGFASNADLNKTSFAGVTGLTASDVLVRYTYLGDNDLSGATTLDDFTLFLNGYQNAGSAWNNGDYDYGGSITLDDFTLFLLGYQRQAAPL